MAISEIAARNQRVIDALLAIDAQCSALHEAGCKPECSFIPASPDAYEFAGALSDLEPTNRETASELVRALIEAVDGTPQSVPVSLFDTPKWLDISGDIAPALGAMPAGGDFFRHLADEHMGNPRDLGVLLSSAWCSSDDWDGNGDMRGLDAGEKAMIILLTAYRPIAQTGPIDLVRIAYAVAAQHYVLKMQLAADGRAITSLVRAIATLDRAIVFMIRAWGATLLQKLASAE